MFNFEKVKKWADKNGLQIIEQKQNGIYKFEKHKEFKNLYRNSNRVFSLLECLIYNENTNETDRKLWCVDAISNHKQIVIILQAFEYLQNLQNELCNLLHLHNYAAHTPTQEEIEELFKGN